MEVTLPERGGGAPGAPQQHKHDRAVELQDVDMAAIRTWKESSGSGVVGEVAGPGDVAAAAWPRTSAFRW